MPGSVVLAEVRTRYELDAIKSWARTAYPDAPVQELTALAVDDLPPDTLLIPARVVWLPPVRQGQRRVALADLLVLTDPHRPRARAQRRIMAREPDRVRVVHGEPATVVDLRARLELDHVGGMPFRRFVAMQASLAAERAERQVIGDRYKVPRLLAEQISATGRFREGVAKLAADLGRPHDVVEQQVIDQLSTFVAPQSRLMDDLFSSTFRNLHERAWQISVDLDSLGRLRALNKQYGLVFLPSHRSYVDPLVLQEGMRAHGFPPTLTLAGDNLSIWPLAPIAQRAGIVFIRRKFGDDPIYKFAMRSYLSHIVEKRFNLEWFIEGGRSRTGKLRKPMVGMLAYVVDAVDRLGGDVMIVPTSIVYDQLGEVNAMAAEAAGGRKQAEGMRWLLRYAKAQQSYRGQARIRFGEPFSLKQALADAGEGRARLDKVAFQVMDQINAATPITATSLAGFALLGAGDRAFTEQEIEGILAPLLGYIDQRGLPGPDPAMSRGIGLRQTLTELRGAGVLSRFDGGPEVVWSIAPNAAPIAAYYRNGALHHFVDRAIVELALLASAQGSIGGADPHRLLAASEQEALRIRDLLKFEFFFPAKGKFIGRLVTELDLLAPTWRTESLTAEATEAILRANADVLVARRTLQPFFDAQFVAAQQLVTLGVQFPGKEVFLDACLGLGRQLNLQGVVRSSDSVSRELYAAALELAENRGLVTAAEDLDLTSARLAFLAEVERMRARLARIAGIEAEERS